MEDRISIKDLHDKSGSLSYNQLVIQSTQRLTEAILKGDCSGLMDFMYHIRAHKNNKILRKRRFAHYNPNAWIQTSELKALELFK
jgi:hypothetical protein